MKEVEESSYNNCNHCGKEFKVTTTRKEYCSPSCGYKDKLANEYHCPSCNEVNYSLDHDPYCSKEHRKKAVSEYDYHRSCRVCGSMFHGTRFDYTCSDYCKKRDEL